MFIRKINQALLLKKALFIAWAVRNTQIRYVDNMQGLLILYEMIRKVPLNFMWLTIIALLLAYCNTGVGGGGRIAVGF